MSKINPPDLECIYNYRRRFADPDYWQPYVSYVCSRHGLVQGDAHPQVGIPGTYPVFTVDRRWTIKFFGRLFDGGDTFLSELDAYTVVSKASGLPVPTLVAQGRLFDEEAEWTWPYMVFEFLPGESLSAVRNSISSANIVAIAQELGRMVSRLHSLSVPKGKSLKPTWETYTRLLENGRTNCVQRHRQFGDLPAHMLNQIEGFLPPVIQLIPKARKPRFLHGDLTADHVLVHQVGSAWRIRALIDLGDTIVGDPLFELIALHLDLFQNNKRLLRDFLQTYRPTLHLSEKQAQRLLALCLLHPCNVFPGFFRRNPEAARLLSLADFASWLWEV